MCIYIYTRNYTHYMYKMFVDTQFLHRFPSHLFMALFERTRSDVRSPSRTS